MQNSNLSSSSETSTRAKLQTLKRSRDFKMKSIGWHRWRRTGISFWLNLMPRVSRWESQRPPSKYPRMTWNWPSLKASPWSSKVANRLTKWENLSTKSLNLKSKLSMLKNSVSSSKLSTRTSLKFWSRNCWRRSAMTVVQGLWLLTLLLQVVTPKTSSSLRSCLVCAAVICLRY